MRTLLTLILLSLLAVAEKVDMPPAALRKTATHVVTGEVKAVYARQTRDDKGAVRHYVAEVKIAKVEKGEGLAVGGLVYARYWRRQWKRPTVGTSGHRGLPEEGETLRLYLARNAYDGFTKDNTDGGFNVIGANGFER